MRMVRPAALIPIVGSSAFPRVHSRHHPACESMGLMGDGYRGTYQGHTIELIRDNLAKKLKLVIDGVEVASQPRAMQHDITLTATLVHEGVSHRVVARSIVGRTTSGTVMIDSAPLTIAKT